MSLIVTLGIIYANLHNRGLAEYQCHYCHTELATTYKHDTGREGRWRVVSQLQQQHTLDLCSVLCCVGHHPSCHYLLDRVQSLLAYSREPWSAV